MHPEREPQGGGGGRGSTRGGGGSTQDRAGNTLKEAGKLRQSREHLDGAGSTLG